MRIIGRIAVFGICVQVFAVMCAAAWGISPLLTQKTFTIKDPSEIAEAYDWEGSESQTGDLSIIQMLWDMNLPGVESVIILMKNMGVPNEFVQPMQFLWRAIMAISIFEWWSGRKVLGDY